jgi:hypothetical protein
MIIGMIDFSKFVEILSGPELFLPGKKVLKKINPRERKT